MDEQRLRYRFLSYVEQSDGCWLWRGAISSEGYGRFSLGKRGVHVYAHRFAWEMDNGPLEAGLVVAHRCDNPPCVRPDHLFAVPQRENLRDMAAKGRQVFQAHPERAARGDRHGTHTRPESIPRGAAHYKAKLTEDQAREVKRRRLAGEPLRALADAFGVTMTTVSLIARGRIWSHLD